jgi:hypothetical protein
MDLAKARNGAASIGADMTRIAQLLILYMSLTPSGYAEERFSGAGNLAPSDMQTSANQRFTVSAELQAAPERPQPSPDGRFSLLAHLTASKSMATNCGVVPAMIFQNGFEN